jgi:hypothetical protein
MPSAAHFARADFNPLIRISSSVTRTSSINSRA